MFHSLLIANRGEIARRVIRTTRRMGIRTIAVMTEADRTWPHWREADEHVEIGEGPAGESYLSIERIVEAAAASGAEAVHPGYGFLSENAAFAEAVGAAGLVFVGPPAAAIRAMGSKADAKALMARAGVPVLPGYGGERQDPAFLKQKAYEVGYPVLIKAVAGGGGRGMRRVGRALDFEDALAATRREALSAFGDDAVLVERYIGTPRHIEVQVFGDVLGNVIHLFERDCSVQRRHQKVLEEAPAPGLSEATREALGAVAVKAARAVGYRGAGTVEFIADGSKHLTPEGFFFIEMNTRLQVEHPVTEAITGLDLVEWQLRVAAGEELPLRQADVSRRGHAIEARLYAEDPAENFRPSTGRLIKAGYPRGAGLRVDAGAEVGSVVSPYYDAMLAKIIAVGADRAEALARLAAALVETRIAGPRTNLSFLSAIVGSLGFRAGGVDTGFIERELDTLLGVPLEPALAAPAIREWLQRETQASAALSGGPWARTDSLELGGIPRLSGLEVVVDGRPVGVEVLWLRQGPEISSIGGVEAEVPSGIEVAWEGSEAFVIAAGRQLRVTFIDPLARDHEDRDRGGVVLAPMHGRVAAVAVAVGAHVARGDFLFSLEAMKMEHSISAPLAGSVRVVGVAAGQQVEQGAVAVEIDPDPVD
jgi:3-methylcrotonyl-CoA carboxylase alpha subunit